MKVLLITSEYPPQVGGVATYYYNLVKNWPEPDKIFVQSEKISGGWFKYLIYFRDLYKNFRTHKIDYIFAGQILPLGPVVWIFSKIFKTKYAVVLHGMDFTYALKTKRRRYLTCQILLGADRLIIGNDYTANLVKNFESKLAAKTIIANGVAGPESSGEFTSISDILKESPRKINHLENKIILLSLGRLVKRKGFDQVIESLKYLPPLVKANLVYVIAGTGPEEAALKNLAAKVKTINSTVAATVAMTEPVVPIIFLGAVSEADKWAWLKISDIFIMPSRNLDGDFEGFGIVYLEANLCGCPVIASQSGGVGAAVKDGINGLIVDSEDPRDIAAKITILAQNQELREELGRNGRRQAAEFSWVKQAQKIFTGLES